MKVGQVTGITTTAERMPSKLCSVVVLQAPLANTNTVLVGDDDSQPIELVPGSSATLYISNLSEVWRKSASGVQSLTWVVG